MAPEQIQGRPGPASDQYSLGIVVYEWLTGDLPFHGSFIEIAAKHIYAPPPSLQERHPTISSPVEEVVMIALAKDPDKRFRSVRAFANALEQASQPPPRAPASDSRRPHTGALPPPSQLRQDTYPTNVVLTGAQNPPLGLPGYTPTEAYPGSPAPVRPPLKSSRPDLSSLFSAAGDALEKVFSGRRRRRTKEFQLSLFAIARAALEEGDRAFVGKSYTVQAGIAQSRPENFAGEPFNLSVESPTEPIFFDVLLHTSENIEPVKEWQKHLRYDPRNPHPQVVEFTFRLVAPGHSSFVINFYRERRWLKTIRFEFDAIEKSMLTAVSSRG